VRDYLGAACAIAVNSCTAALELSLSLHEIAGCDVLLPAYTFVSTANAVVRLNGYPRFVDSDPQNCNISVADLERTISEDYQREGDRLFHKRERRQLKGIIVVHFAGQPVELERVRELAARNRLFVIEDAAHAFGASRHGIMIGKSPDLVCFSFYSNKNITTGEGGMIVTDSAPQERELRTRALHGLSSDNLSRYKQGAVLYDVSYPGFKYNLSDLNAAVGLAQLGKIDEINHRRAEAVALYNDMLGDFEEARPLTIDSANRSSYHLYPVFLKTELAASRDDLVSYFRSQGVEVSVHFKPVHLFSFYAGFLKEKPQLVNAELLFQREISLPLFPALKEKQIRKVVAVLRGYFANKK
jgi:dTDP-4-amino-4,6-dideoxygalactose transaminase